MEKWYSILKKVNGRIIDWFNPSRKQVANTGVGFKNMHIICACNLTQNFFPKEIDMFTSSLVGAFISGFLIMKDLKPKYLTSEGVIWKVLAYLQNRMELLNEMTRARGSLCISSDPDFWACVQLCLLKGY